MQWITKDGFEVSQSMSKATEILIFLKEMYETYLQNMRIIDKIAKN